MTTPSWARPLTGDADPQLVASAVRLASSGRVSAQRVQRIVAARLEAAGATTLDVDADRSGPGGVGVAAVLADLMTSMTRDSGTSDESRAAAAAARLAAHHARVWIVGERGYPAALATAWPELGAPPWLFATGRVVAEPAVLARPAVAVVGTRDPSLDGLRSARRLGQILGEQGIVVVSGLARGIDQEAHRGALEAGGPTVAVLGAGFDVDYPRGAATLRAEVAAAGGLVTELAPDAPPRPRHFLARNRIVAGLAAATVVVEGRLRSGALATARLAAAQGRDVAAVPGSPHQATARAPLELIRDGVQPLCRLDDVLELVDVDTSPAACSDSAAASPAPALEPEAARVLGLLGPTPAAIDEVAARASLPVSVVLATVGDLVRRGLATQTPRGLVATGGTPAGASGGAAPP